jgi:tetratricopeptide (TPR) repeat protein
MTTGAFAMAGMALVRMGRFADAERHLARAEDSLRVAADPGTEGLLQHARGMLRFAQGRFDEALAEFARAEGLERLLASEHVFTVDVRARALHVRVRMGDTESAQDALAGFEPGTAQPRRDADRAGGSAARKDNSEQAVEALAPVIDGSAPALYERWARAEALLLDATARDRLGDRRGGGGDARGAARATRPAAAMTASRSCS